MKFKYVGPFEAVDVPELGLVDVARGDVIEASGPVAESFSAQDAWQRVDRPKPRAKKAAAKKTASKTPDTDTTEE